MNAFIVPRAQKKQQLPFITMEEVANVLILYLSTISEYIHSSVDIECDPAARSTTLALAGQAKGDVNRRIAARVTITGRTAADLKTRIWADPIPVQIESGDLGLTLDLVVEPHADRTIAITQRKGSSNLRPAQKDQPSRPEAPALVSAQEPLGVASAQGSVVEEVATVSEKPAPAAESERIAEEVPAKEHSKPGVTVAIASNDNKSAHSEGSSESASVEQLAPELGAGDLGEVVPNSQDVSETDFQPVPENPMAKPDEIVQAVAGPETATEAMISPAPETQPEQPNVATAAEDAPTSTVEPAETDDAVSEPRTGTPTDLSQGDTNSAADCVRSVDALASEGPAGVEQGSAAVANTLSGENEAVVEGAPEVLFENVDTIAAEEKPAAEIEPDSMVVLTSGPEQIEIVNVPEAAEPDPSKAEVETVAEAVANPELEEFDREYERAQLNVDRPITVTEVLGDAEDLILDIHAPLPMAAVETASELSVLTTGSSPDPADARPAIDATETATVGGRADTSANSVGNAHVTNSAQDAGGDETATDLSAARPMPSLEELQADDVEFKDRVDPPGADGAFASTQVEFGSSDEMIHSATEQAIFGPGQKKRCAIVKGDGKFAMAIVGETHYQQELEQIASAHGATKRRLVAALLVPEPNNFFDKHAVAVQIDKRTIGYLAFEVGPVFLRALTESDCDSAAVAAAIIEGVMRDDNAAGEFAVKLDAVVPFVLSDGTRMSPDDGVRTKSADARAA